MQTIAKRLTKAGLTNDQRITDSSCERSDIYHTNNCRSSYHNHVQKSLGKKPT